MKTDFRTFAAIGITLVISIAILTLTKTPVRAVWKGEKGEVQIELGRQ